jgi:hypothetical protein
MGRRAHTKDATLMKRARALGFTEQQIMNALGIEYAWYRRCWNEEAGLSSEHLNLLSQLIATQLPAAPTLSLENGAPIHLPGPGFSLTIESKPHSEVTIAIRLNTTGQAQPLLSITPQVE